MSYPHPEPRPCGRPLPTYSSPADVQTQFCLSLCGSLGPGPHKVCLSPLSISGSNGIWFYTQIHPSYHLAGASPLPLDVGYLLTATPVPTVLLEFSDLGCGMSPHCRSSRAQELLLTLDMGYLLSATTGPRSRRSPLQLTILIPYWSYSLQIFSPIQ